MEAIGQLTGGLAHDFNNMLTGVLGSLDLIQRRVASGSTGDLDRYIDAATTSANRAAALTHRLLAFARRQSLDPKPVDVNMLVVSMEDMLRRTMGEHIQLEVDLQADAWLAYTDGHQLENALLNLVINARDAMPNGGRLGVHTKTSASSSTSPTRRSPATTWCSASPTTVPACRRRPSPRRSIRSSPPSRSARAPALACRWSTASPSRPAAMYASTAPSARHRVTLYLPRNLSDDQAQPGPAQATDMPGARSGEIVLVVEDEAAVRMLVVEVLQELGYQVLEACDATSALPYLHGDQRLDLLVSDFGLPGSTVGSWWKAPGSIARN